MTINDLFDWQKKKRLRVAFALYSPEEDDLPAETAKWYVDSADLANPVVAIWRPTGLVTVSKTTLADYQENWDEFLRQCKKARVDTLGWNNEKNHAAGMLACSKDRNQKRFWASVLEALNFYQMDTRV